MEESKFEEKLIKKERDLSKFLYLKDFTGHMDQSPLSKEKIELENSHLVEVQST